MCRSNENVREVQEKYGLEEKSGYGIVSRLNDFFFLLNSKGPFSYV